MKILILMKSYDTMYFFRGIADRLISLGHKVSVIHSAYSALSGGDYNVTRRDWQVFDVELIYRIKPDVILVWNGYQFGAGPVTTMLKKSFRVLHVEMGWLPQDKFLYIADELGPDSYIAKDIDIRQTFSEAETQKLENLRKIYRFEDTCKLPDLYIFVPLQLDYDTAITMFSPHFKTMESFVGYVRWHCGNYNIVVKPHPKEKNKLDLGTGVTVISGVSSNELSARSLAVIGINSTCLIEALVHHKPVINFGHNVVMRAQSVKDRLEIIEEPAYIADSKLLHLLDKQVAFLDPQPWVIDYILGQTNDQS